MAKALNPSRDAIFAMMELVTPEMHRMIFRGKNLGSVVTEEQKAAIKSDKFTDIFLGDYWVINGVTWRVWDFDYWIHCGDTDFTTPHLVIVPDKVLYSRGMNPDNTTEGGYVGSEMYKTGLNQAKNTITNAFGGMVLTHREYLVNAVTNGHPSNSAWYHSTVELMNEIMIYGTRVYDTANTGTATPVLYTVNNSQLALAQAVPKFFKTRQSYWLRDVVSATSFACIVGNGGANANGANAIRGVRPVFAIG